MMLKKLSILLFFCSLVACQLPSALEEGDLDVAAWRNDPNGCANVRDSLRVRLMEIKEKLYKLSEAEVMHLLGKPDKQELHERKQKFYYYYVNAGNQCDTTLSNEGNRISLRFSAVGVVNDVRFEYR